MKHLLSLITIVLMTTNCSSQWGQKINGNGKTVSLERSVGDYEAIAVSGWFDVVLVEGNEGNLTLKGEENLLEHVITEVEKGKLVIKIEKGYNLKPSSWKEGITITVPIEHIDAVELSGSGDIVGKKTIKAQNFKTSMSGSGDITLQVESDTMTATMSGSGDMNLSGKTGTFEATISGSGDIRAYDLEADNVEATVSGSADIKVTAREMLKARVSGSGDISYKGNPKKIDTKTSGSGDITKG